ncbi:olfactory receptor 6C3-like [Bombina bombina]|uniref:olfactory receptor 6C3-like n=1 Tax=Bombina bombina TaxID=8345 RepID=UPI00235AED98|nr:olfactory receptor 6C3-like [Bombina bombina]
MNSVNQTMVNYFIIKGISNVPEFQAPIFLLVLLIYLTTLGGNTTILLLVFMDTQLHTPMYFFLVNLSLIDIFSTTVTLHKVLTSFITQNKTISFMGCLTQLYFFASLTGNELLILTAMSYDRYVAICKPLHYHLLMNRRVCGLLATFCWTWGFIEIIPHVVIISDFTCYLSNEIDHFVCDFVPLQKLICNDTFIFNIAVFLVAIFLAVFPSLLTFIPYIFIIACILRIPSKSGRRKAFYTCSSHLTVVIILYCTLIFQYLRPVSEGSLEFNKLFSLFNTATVPMLNPMIYSLKNSDVKSALRRRLKSCKVTAF